ncbi:MAG: recombinase family protein [Candidatus Buchananbacteria bacterium]
MKYYLYARKSTEDEERQKMSIEAQLAELADYAQKEGIEVIEKFTESKSAKKPGRKVFNEMIAKIQASDEPVGLLSWHPDRLARNSVDGGQIIYLIDDGKLASLRFPTFWFEPTPQGLFMLQVSFGQSKYYSDNLSENVKRGIRQKLRRGEWYNLAPFGYTNNLKTRNIEPDPIKSRIVKKVFKDFATGNHTLKSMGQRLSFWGVINRSGKTLTKSSVKRILNNKAYLGIITHRGEEFEGNFEPIVSLDIFEAVQNLLNRRARPRKSKKCHYFPFTGLLTCGECGAAITAQWSKGRYRYYRCTKRLGKCSQKYLSEDLLAEQLKSRLQKISISDDWAKNMLEQVDVWEKEKDQSSQIFAQNLKVKTKEADNRLDKLIDSYLDELIDKDAYLKRKSELIKTKTDLNRQRSDFGRTGNNWNELLRNWIKDANCAQKLALSKDFIAIKSFAEKIGTNRRLLDKNVIWDWAKPWEILAKYKSEFETICEQSSLGNFGKNYESIMMRSGDWLNKLKSFAV